VGGPGSFPGGPGNGPERWLVALEVVFFGLGPMADEKEIVIAAWNVR
jgi:hypothetical protein